MGLYGEVGSIMTTAKKYHREKAAYAGFQQAAEEEFGDALWYFTTLCRRLGVSIETIFSEAVKQDGYSKILAASDLPYGPVSHISSARPLPILEKALLKLGEATAHCLESRNWINGHALCCTRSQIATYRHFKRPT